MPIDFDKLRQRIAEQNKADEIRRQKQAEWRRSETMKKLESGASLASELRQWLQKNSEDVEVSEAE